MVQKESRFTLLCSLSPPSQGQELLSIQSLAQNRALSVEHWTSGEELEPGDAL